MRILITGGGGNVGRGLTGPLLAAGHELVVSDIVRPAWLAGHPDVEFHQVDVQIGVGLERAAEGCDVIVHTPAWHGIHTGVRTEVDFWRLNVDGTMWMTQAAVATGARVLFLSSQAWHDHYDKYGFTKRMGEELLAYQHRRAGLSYVALRPAAFTPWEGDWPQEYGARLLGIGVDRRDVLQAALRSIDYLSRTPDADLIVDAVRANVFSADDIEGWEADPIGAAERIFPGARDVVERFGLDISATPHLQPSSGWAEIGYQPEHHFGTFLAEISGMDVNEARDLPCDYRA